MLYPLSYGGSRMLSLAGSHHCAPPDDLGGMASVGLHAAARLRGDVQEAFASALFFPPGTRPPTEVGARALRFSRPARRSGARAHLHPT